MHEFTVRHIHDDRMAQLVREADAYRLATAARRPSRPNGFAHTLPSLSMISAALRWLRAKLSVRQVAAEAANTGD